MQTETQLHTEHGRNLGWLCKHTITLPTLSGQDGTVKPEQDRAATDQELCQSGPEHSLPSFCRGVLVTRTCQAGQGLLAITKAAATLSEQVCLVFK